MYEVSGDGVGVMGLLTGWRHRRAIRNVYREVLRDTYMVLARDPWLDRRAVMRVALSDYQPYEPPVRTSMTPFAHEVVSDATKTEFQPKAVV